MADSSGNFQFPSASPIASSGVDYDEFLASLAQGGTRSGSNVLPWPVAGGGQSAAPQVQAASPAPSQMAQAAATPEHQAAQAAAPHLANAIKAAAPILGPEKTSSLAAAFTAGMNGQAPVTGGAAAPTAATGTAAVPGNISPTGGATAQGNPVNPNNVRDGVPATGAGNPATAAAAPGAAGATAAPDINKPLDPLDPVYRATKWQKFGRGVVGALVGAGKGAQTGNPLAVIGGGIAGAADPASEGATPYGAPNRKFSVAAQQRALQIQNAATNAETNLKTAQADAAATVPVTALMAIANPALAPYVGTTLSQRTFGSLGGAAIKAQGAENVADTTVQGKKDVQADKDAAMKDLRDAQAEEANAKAELARAGNDPNSPAYKLALRRANTASSNASAAMIRANAYSLNANAGNLGVDNQGNQIQGGATTADGKPIGSRFAAPYIKQEGKTAQFNDVLDATDNIELTAQRLVQKGGKLNSPRVAAAIADPKSTSIQWAQGEFATSGLTPEERDYVTNVKAYTENLQALRASMPAGSSSDAQVNRLMHMAPGAGTPDLDYLKEQTRQIRLTASRLAEGMPHMKGGHAVRGGNKPAAKPETSAAPPSGASQEVWLKGQLAGHVVNNKYVPLEKK